MIINSDYSSHSIFFFIQNTDLLCHFDMFSPLSQNNLSKKEAKTHNIHFDELPLLLKIT